MAGLFKVLRKSKEMIFENELNTTNVSSNKLGIKSGLTQEQFNQAIVTYLENLSTSVSSGTQATLASASDLATNAGKNVVKSLNFEPTGADIKTELKDSTIDLTYDLSKALASIPKDAQIRRTNVIVHGSKTVVANTDKPSQVISVSPSEFPINVDVTIRGESSDGAFLIKGSQTLRPENNEQILTFETSTTEARPITTQEELNIKLLQDVEYLKRMMSK